MENPQSENQPLFPQESEIVTSVIPVTPIEESKEVIEAAIDANLELQASYNDQVSEIQVLRQKLAEIGALASLPHAEVNCQKLSKNILDIVNKK